MKSFVAYYHESRTQSRVAKMEAADGSVTLDLMMRSMLAIGATPGDVTKLIKIVETHRAV
jgi:hypothetical protein